MSEKSVDELKRKVDEARAHLEKLEAERVQLPQQYLEAVRQGDAEGAAEIQRHYDELPSAIRAAKAAYLSAQITLAQAEQTWATAEHNDLRPKLRELFEKRKALDKEIAAMQAKIEVASGDMHFWRQRTAALEAQLAELLAEADASVGPVVRSRLHRR